jgi:hypothetical protein
MSTMQVLLVRHGQSLNNVLMAEIDRRAAQGLITPAQAEAEWLAERVDDPPLTEEVPATQAITAQHTEHSAAKRPPPPRPWQLGIRRHVLLHAHARAVRRRACARHGSWRSSTRPCSVARGAVSASCPRPSCARARRASHWPRRWVRPAPRWWCTRTSTKRGACTRPAGTRRRGRCGGRGHGLRPAVVRLPSQLHRSTPSRSLSLSHTGGRAGGALARRPYAWRLGSASARPRSPRASRATMSRGCRPRAPGTPRRTRSVITQADDTS